MLAFALTGGVNALWLIFATSNQLLAAFVLLLAALWLLRQGRRMWFAFIPALFMLATTVASLFLLLGQFWADRSHKATLLVADVILIVITAYLLVVGVRTAVDHFRGRKSVED